MTVVESHDDHLAGPRAEHVLGEQVADARGRVDPVRASRTRAARPTRATMRGQPVARGERQPAERVAVEVDARSGSVDRRSGRGSRAAGRRRRARAASLAASARVHSTTACATAGSPGRGARSGPRPAQHDELASSPAARASANSSLIAGGTMSSLPPCVNSAGTPSGSRAAGRGGGVAVGHLLGRAAEQARARRRRRAATPTRARGRARRPATTDAGHAARSRPGARRRRSAARWPPAEWPIVDTRVRSSGAVQHAQVVDRRRRRRRTCVGQPPPLSRPSRRYSRFHAAQPRADEVARTAGASACARSAPSRSRRG